MSTGTGIALTDGVGGSFVDSDGSMIILQPSVGTFLFLYDHYVDDEFIQAGETREMFYPWVPTADVEPLDSTAVQSFYNVGPTLGAVIRTRFQPFPIRRPVTYWYQVSPWLWALAGLGANLAPVSDPGLGRIEDK